MSLGSLFAILWTKVGMLMYVVSLLGTSSTRQYGFNVSIFLRRFCPRCENQTLKRYPVIPTSCRLSSSQNGSCLNKYIFDIFGPLVTYILQSLAFLSTVHSMYFSITWSKTICFVFAVHPFQEPGDHRSVPCLAKNPRSGKWDPGALGLPDRKPPVHGDVDRKPTIYRDHTEGFWTDTIYWESLQRQQDDHDVIPHEWWVMNVFSVRSCGIVESPGKSTSIDYHKTFIFHGMFPMSGLAFCFCLRHVSRAGYCCHWSQDEGLWILVMY